MNQGLGSRLADVPNPPGIEGLVVRHLAPEDDYVALADLTAVVNLHDGGQSMPAAAEIRHDWEHDEGMDLAEDVIVAELRGALIGFALHSWRVRGSQVFHRVEVMVRPDWRRRGLGRALLNWTEARVARSLAGGQSGAQLGLPHVLSGWVDMARPDAAPWATNAGYSINGYFVNLTRSLKEPIVDLAVPAGFELRPVRPEDHRRIWDADTEAFLDHRDPALRTDGDFEGWFSHPDLDTGLWLVAWAGEEVAGSVMNAVYPEENARLGVRRGWLDHVSVRRPWRNRGLARSLIAQSLRLLAERGLDEAALWADAENLTGAVQLYESVGFARVRTNAGMRKSISIS